MGTAVLNGTGVLPDNKKYAVVPDIKQRRHDVSRRLRKLGFKLLVEDENGIETEAEEEKDQW